MKRVNSSSPLAYSGVMRQYVLGRGTEAIEGEVKFSDAEVLEECAIAIGKEFSNECARVVSTIIDACSATPPGELPGPQHRLAHEEALRNLPKLVWFNTVTGKATLDPESEALDLCTWCYDMVYEEAILCPNCWGAGIRVKEEVLEAFVEVRSRDVFSLDEATRVVGV